RYLVEERLLSAAQPERERLEVFARSEVHLVGQVVGVERHVLVERLLRLLDDLVSFLFEQGAEFLELSLVHVGSWFHFWARGPAKRAREVKHLVGQRQCDLSPGRRISAPARSGGRAQAEHPQPPVAPQESLQGSRNEI